MLVLVILLDLLHGQLGVLLHDGSLAVVGGEEGVLLLEVEGLVDFAAVDCRFVDFGLGFLWVLLQLDRVLTV